MYYTQLTTEEKALVESQVTNNQKNIGIAYLLWFFGGPFGLHRFYISGGFSGAGFAQLLLSICGYLTLIILIGFVFLGVVGLWLLVDVFLISGLVQKESKNLKEKYAEELVNSREAV